MYPDLTRTATALRLAEANSGIPRNEWRLDTENLGEVRCAWCGRLIRYTFIKGGYVSDGACSLCEAKLMKGVA